MGIGAILTYVVLCFFAGCYAEKKGKGCFLFFIISLLLSPLLTFIYLAISSPNTDKLEKQQIIQGNMKKCPHCAEMIKTEANICRYCSNDVSQVKHSETSGNFGDLEQTFINLYESSSNKDKITESMTRTYNKLKNGEKSKKAILEAAINNLI